MRRGAGKLETFDFLGFTHYRRQMRKGWFIVRGKSMAKRVRNKRKQGKLELRR